MKLKKMENILPNILYSVGAIKLLASFIPPFLMNLKNMHTFNTNENNVRNYETRIIAMFHSDTDLDVKEHVIRAFLIKMVLLGLFSQQLHLEWV